VNVRFVEVMVGVAVLGVGVGRATTLWSGIDPPPWFVAAEPWVWALFAIEYGLSNIFWPYYNDGEEEAP